MDDYEECDSIDSSINYSSCNSSCDNSTEYIFEEVEKSLLYIACKERNIDLIKSILNSCNKIDEEAYFLVCSNGDVETLKLILEYNKYKNKLDIHINNEYSLKIACKNNRLNIIEHLIEFGESNNNKFNVNINDYEIIKMACKCNYVDIVKYIISYVNNRYIQIIYSACISNNSELIDYIISFFNLTDMLDNIDIILHNMFYIATRNDCLEIIKYLLNKYPKINYMSVSKIYIYSSINDNTNIVHYLFGNIDLYSQHCHDSTDLLVINNTQNVLTKIFESLLNDSCEKGCINIVKYIINCSEKNNIQLDLKGIYDKGPFYYACRSNNIELVQFIIQYTQYDELYIIAGLKQACTMGNYDIVKYLLDIIIQCNITYTDFEYLFVVSCKSTNTKLTCYILSYNSDINNIDVHCFDDQLLYMSCMTGNLDMFKLLYDYSIKINSPFDIHNNLHILLSCVCNSNNIDFIDYLVKYNKENTYNVLKSIINETHTYSNILYSVSRKIILQYLIEYCFYNNIVIYSSTEQILIEILESNLSNNSKNDIIEYIIYLLKHNYNKCKYKLFTPKRRNLYKHNILNNLSRNYIFIFTRKYIDYNSIKYIKSNMHCTHFIKHVSNNNIVCFKCRGYISIYSDYILHIV